MTRRVEILGSPVDALSMQETVDRCIEIVEAGECVQHVAINAAKVVASRVDPRLREVIRGCGLISADGQAVVWASRLLGTPLPERVAGIDLMYRLLAVAADRGWLVCVLGARRDVLEAAVAELRRLYPSLRIVPYRDGYFRDDESAQVATGIRALRADVLFVAMSSPRKEYWLAEHARELGTPLLVGVGGAIDVVAGMTKRAPSWMQHSGLEWLFRFIQEPRRLGRRYLTTNARFLALVALELMHLRRRAGQT